MFIRKIERLAKNETTMTKRNRIENSASLLSVISTRMHYLVAVENLNVRKTIPLLKIGADFGLTLAKTL